MEVVVDLVQMLSSFKAATAENLTVNEMLVLATVVAEPSKPQAHHLKTVELGFTRQNLSLVVKKLVDKGLVEYVQPDPESPTKVLNPTEAGRALCSRWQEAVRGNLEMNW